MNSTSTQHKTKRLSLKAIFSAVALMMISSAAMAQLTTTDSVCAGSQDVVYGVSGAVSTNTYTWFLDDPTAGTIDNSVTANGSEIEIDWGLTTGTYTLSVYSTSDEGCIGDTMDLDIVINPLPTVTIVSDSVCEGFQATLTFDLTGEAPWTIDYTDGTTPVTITANSTPHVVTLPPYTTSQTITVTGVTDANTCDADAAGLPSTNVTIHPKPTTGAIFHY